MITVYLVGPLFTEADQRQRRLEGERLRRSICRLMKAALLRRKRFLRQTIIISAKQRMCFSIWPMRIPAVIWRWGFCWRKN